MAAHIESPKWLPLAEQASKEEDVRKLGALIEQLCRAIDMEIKPKGDSTDRARHFWTDNQNRILAVKGQTPVTTTLKTIIEYVVLALIVIVAVRFFTKR